MGARGDGMDERRPTGADVVSDEGPPACPRCKSTMVRRVRGADGSAFWGCPRFPSCRGTRPIEAASPAPTPVEPAPVSIVDRAGASADRQFQLRRGRHEAKVQAARPRILAYGIAVVLVGLALATGIAGPIVAPLGWPLVFVGVTGTVVRLYVLPQHVQAWDVGGDGERRTAEILEPLRAEGFVLFHDRAIPRSRANIDHIVVGPTGVWVVESKSYGGRLRVEGGELRVNGRRRAGVRGEVEREMAAVARVVDPTPVAAVIVVHRAEFPFFARLTLDGVPVVPGGALVDRIRSGVPALTGSVITDLATRIDRALPAAAGRTVSDPGT